MNSQSVQKYFIGSCILTIESLKKVSFFEK